MIKITCLIVSHISSLAPCFGKLPSKKFSTLDLKTFVSRKISSKPMLFFIFCNIHYHNSFNIWNIYNVYTKISDISVNENFDFSYKEKYFRTWNLQIQKQQYFLSRKKQTTPNLQFAGDVKFAGDNPIDPFKPKNITLKINETPHLLVK